MAEYASLTFPGKIGQLSLVHLFLCFSAMNVLE